MPMVGRELILRAPLALTNGKVLWSVEGIAQFSTDSGTVRWDVIDVCVGSIDSVPGMGSQLSSSGSIFSEPTSPLCWFFQDFEHLRALRG